MGLCLSDEALLPRVPPRAFAFIPEVLLCILGSWVILGLDVEAETSGLFPLLEPFRSASNDLSIEWRSNVDLFWSSAEER
jgi:hypothetical protein